MEKFNKKEQKNSHKIETKFYEAVCEPYNINIKWKNGILHIYKENKETLNETINRIYEYSEQEILFYYQKNLYYSKRGGEKNIIKNIDIDIWTIDYFYKCKKISALANKDDPPESLYIFSISEIINNPVDMEDEKSTNKYLVNNCSAFKTSYRRDESDYYVIHDDGMDIIDVETLERTSTF